MQLVKNPLSQQLNSTKSALPPSTQAPPLTLYCLCLKGGDPFFTNCKYRHHTPLEGKEMQEEQIRCILKRRAMMDGNILWQINTKIINAQEWNSISKTAPLAGQKQELGALQRERKCTNTSLLFLCRFQGFQKGGFTVPMLLQHKVY